MDQNLLGLAPNSTCFTHPGPNGSMWFFKQVPENFLEPSQPARPEDLQFLFLHLVIPVQQLPLLVISLDAASFQIQNVNSPILQVLYRRNNVQKILKFCYLNALFTCEQAMTHVSSPRCNIPVRRKLKIELKLRGCLYQLFKKIVVN